MGKSALGAHIVSAVAESGKAAQVNTLEMPREQWALRLPCTFAGVDSLAVRRNQMSTENWSSLTGAMDQIIRMPIYINDKAGESVESIRAAVRRRQAKLERDGKQLGVLVVDYLQLCDGRGAGRDANREQQVAHISRSLKEIAKDSRIGVVALSQLSRAVESRDNKRPVLSDLRESGQIEQDADVIIFAYRHQYYDKGCADAVKGVCELDVKKARSGQTGMVLARCEERLTRFTDLNIGAQEAYVEHWRQPDASDGRGKFRRAS